MVLARGLGNASGSITVDISQLTSAGGAVLRVASSMSSAFDDVDKSSEAFAKNAALGFGSLATGGIVAAQRVKAITAVFEALSSSEQQAAIYMGQLRDLAEEAKQPYIDLLEGAKDLLPTVRQYNLDFAQTVRLSQQLAVYDPAQGLRGASLALREFFSGNYYSLQRRFELSRETLRGILEDSNGNMAAAAQGLDDYISRIGLSSEALIKMGQDGVFAFDRMKSEMSELLASAFTPLLNEGILPLLDGLIAIFRQAQAMDPVFTSLIGKITATLGGGALLNRIGLTGLGTIVTAAGATNIAVDIGVAVARALAQAGGQDTPLANASQGEARQMFTNEANRVAQQGFTALGQVVAIVVYQFRRLSESADAVSFWIYDLVRNIGSQISTIIDYVKVIFQQAGDEITTIFANIALSIGLAFERNAPEGFLKDFGTNLTNAALAMFPSDERILDLQAQRESLEQAFATLKETVPNLAEYLNNVNLEDAGPEMLRIVAFFQAIGQGLFPIGEEIQSEAQSMADNITEGSDALADAFNSVINSDDFKRIGEKIRDFAQAISEATDRRFLDTTRESEDFARGRLRDLFDYNAVGQRNTEDEAAREKEQRDKISQIIADSNDEIKKKQESFGKDELRRLEDHQDNLRHIQEDAFDDLVDAIARGSGAGAIRAVRDAEKQTKRENEEFDKKKRRYQEDYDLEKQSIDDRQALRIQAAEDELTQMQDNFKKQEIRRAQTFELQLQREDEDRAIRLNREQENFDLQRALQIRHNQQEIANLSAKLFQEEGLTSAFLGQFQNLMGNIRDFTLNTWNQIFNGMQSTQSGTYGGKTSSPIINTGKAFVDQALSDFYATYSKNKLNQQYYSTPPLPAYDSKAKSSNYTVAINSPITVNGVTSGNIDDVANELAQKILSGINRGLQNVIRIVDPL